MSKRVEPEIPNITLDHDHAKPTRTSTAKKTQQQGSSSASNTPKSNTLFKTLLVVMPYVALLGATGYFYQQQVTVNQVITSSSQRILQLENQLSATGEEMGESTIALKIKLESIGEKTELLLSEMDKLWASAWRKNQKEIKALNSQSIKLGQQQDKNTNASADLKDKITATEFAISAVSEQIVALNSLQDELKKLSSQLNTLDANAKTRDKQQMVTATTINEFDTSLQLLLERMERLESQIANKPQG